LPGQGPRPASSVCGPAGSMRKKHYIGLGWGQVSAALVCGILSATFGCAGPENTVWLQQAWEYAAADSLSQAYPLARNYALAHPDSPTAHFLLGRCYANLPKPELTRAKGEFDMAAFLLRDVSRMDLPDREQTLEEFQSAIHYETALVLVRIVAEAGKAGMSKQATSGILATALHHVREGMRLSPASQELIALEERLMATLESFGGGNVVPPPSSSRHFI